MGTPAPDTLGQMVGRLQLYVPQLPYFLAVEFIKSAYQRLLDRRSWGALRAEGEFIIDDAKEDGTVAVTRESTSVTGSGTSFASSDIGRQFKTGNASPVYTITNVVGQVLTLDRAYGGEDDSSASYKVFDGYITAPSDFQQFISVLDPTQGIRLRHWATQEVLSNLDPRRQNFGQPYLVVDRRYSSAGLAQFELWPYSVSARNYPYYYYKRGSDLTNDTDTPIWPLRSDIIEMSARADMCMWPGTLTHPNPMFGRIELYDRLNRQVDDALVDMIRQDEDIYLTWLSTQNWSDWPVIPLSANFIQSHAV